MSKRIYKPKPISGFPEYLPEARLVQQQWLDHIRSVFESYGYCSIETPSVEELDALRAKGESGEVDKEIYVLERLHKDDGEDSESRLALHFDQTVPLARYTAQHFNDLVFPFKRYQIQKVWRGERPQLGRMREFYQCDIDVINVDHLPLHFDAEMPAVIYEALTGLDIGRIQVKVSNRKILLGLLESIDVSGETSVQVLRSVDRLDKIGIEGVEDELSNLIAADKIPAVTAFLNTDYKTLKPANDQMAEGLEELKFVMDHLKHLPEGAVVADLSMVRGLDYYTGTVYETRLLDMPEFTSSVCSGGRYDDLASSYINKKLPGVGISIGFSRLFDVLLQSGQIKTGAKSPAQILVVIPNKEQWDGATITAQKLRSRGFKTELYHAPQKLGKQLGYAEKKGIRYVWFPPFEDGNAHEVKDMQKGEQTEANPENWSPDV